MDSPGDLVPDVHPGITREREPLVCVGLLDVLEALADQRDAVVLIGAQAVYLRSRDAQLSVSAYTTDGDLDIDPTRLCDQPRLEAAMRAAGFEALSKDGCHQPGQ